MGHFDLFDSSTLSTPSTLPLSSTHGLWQFRSSLRSTLMPHCFLALGGNVGDVEQTFREVLRRLGGAPNCALRATSRFFRTAAVGDRAGPDFLNAAAELETELSPLELLDLLQSLEHDLGRVRETHWGARTL